MGLLANIIYVLSALLKLGYFLMVVLYLSVGTDAGLTTVEGLILSYGVGLLLYFQPLPYAHDMPSKLKIILWGVALILLYVTNMNLWWLVGHYPSLISL